MNEIWQTDKESSYFIRVAHDMDEHRATKLCRNLNKDAIHAQFVILPANTKRLTNLYFPN